MKTLSVIVPCFNEEAVIATTYDRIKKLMSELNISIRSIFIND
jgi:dolichol-phosphate mannosyltransferase